ncbi:MAG: 1,6-anhydro-N-acetylmuramyl-L-alanine amidase AmpD [Succinivibrionaceae bacterium]|nr:1,6-anhydro-N-acetylmuramyl-L-alanine amidase AmpD [Succinivibrionaceae bacterium]
MIPVIVAGWLQGARQVPTSHFGPRPRGAAISLVVIHGISLPPGQFGGHFVDAIMTGTLDPAAHPYFATVAHLEVSTHAFISRTGAITQYVSFLDRAWHAGRSSYQGVPECNDYSVGIELEGTDDLPYTDAQYGALIPLVAALRHSYPGIGDRLAGHSDVAPGRKTDPGPHFDWARLRRGLS